MLRQVCRPTARTFHHYTQTYPSWLDTASKIYEEKSQSMWAARAGRVLLFDVRPAHRANLEQHWDAYKLNDRIGLPKDTVWGELEHIVDYRNL
tara:strand:- start:52 stop:330 length:279 start_codon:yes stop_codon:yes gene_type:complete